VADAVASGWPHPERHDAPLHPRRRYFPDGGREIDLQVTARLAGFAGVALLIGPEPLVGGALQDDEIARSRPPRTDHCKYRVDSADHAADRCSPGTLRWCPRTRSGGSRPGGAVDALAYVFYFRILAAAGATNCLLVTFLITGTGRPAGAAVWANGGWRHFAGKWP